MFLIFMGSSQNTLQRNMTFNNYWQPAVDSKQTNQVMFQSAQRDGPQEIKTANKRPISQGDVTTEPVILSDICSAFFSNVWKYQIYFFAFRGKMPEPLSFLIRHNFPLEKGKKVY